METLSAAAVTHGGGREGETESQGERQGEAERERQADGDTEEQRDRRGKGKRTSNRRERGRATENRRRRLRIAEHVGSQVRVRKRAPSPTASTGLLPIHRGVGARADGPAPHATPRAGRAPLALNPPVMRRGGMKIPKNDDPWVPLGTAKHPPWATPQHVARPHADAGPPARMPTCRACQSQAPELKRKQRAGAGHAARTPAAPAAAIRVHAAHTCTHLHAGMTRCAWSHTHTWMHWPRCGHVHTPEINPRPFWDPIPPGSGDPTSAP